MFQGRVMQPRKRKQCPICGATVSSGNLTRHQRSQACFVNAKPSDESPAVIHGRDEPPEKRPKRQCDVCGVFVSADHMKRHKSSGKCSAHIIPPSGVLPTALGAGHPEKLPCPICDKPVTKDNLKRHQTSQSCSQRRTLQVAQTLPSGLSVSLVPAAVSTEPSTSLVSNEIPEVITVDVDVLPVSIDTSDSESEEIKEVQTAFKNRLKTYKVCNPRNIKDPKMFLEGSKPVVLDKLRETISNQGNVKVNFVLLATFKRATDAEDDVEEFNFKTQNQALYPTTDLSTFYDGSVERMLVEMEDFHAKGSGWTLKRIGCVELRINRFVPLGGSSYIPLPQAIKSRKAVINVRNDDHKCFLWSVLAALHPVGHGKHPYRVHHYEPFQHELDSALEGISFPVDLGDIPKFIKRSGLSINVYGYTTKHVVYPLYVNDDYKAGDTHIDLLYVRKGGNTHYCYIKDLSRLVRAQITRDHRKIWLCRRCLSHFGREDLLKSHLEYCNKHDAVRIVLPDEKADIEFRGYSKMERVPVVFYADFESLLRPIDTCQPPPFQLKPDENGHLVEKDTPYTNRYQSHEVISFCLYKVQKTGGYTEPIEYFGADANLRFVEELSKEARALTARYEQFKKLKDEDLTAEDRVKILTQKKCSICYRPLGEEGGVRDHDHFTGKFRGMAHKDCNLRYQKSVFIPIFVHNLSGYDTHLFIKMLGLNGETVEVIPNTEERYISYTVKVKDGVKLRFVDSFRFMASSLDGLVKNLTRDQCRHTSQRFTGTQLDLALRKGVYPYDYMSSIERFEETSLPGIADFYNRLNKSHVSEEDYEHARLVWREFNIQNMREYTRLYNLTDVLLLADVMENFRDVCMATYKLDPAWYFTSPGLAWDAMLKVSGISLQPLTDIDMILMIEAGIRGGLSQCSNRYARANNPYLQSYDPTIPNSYLAYLDANNLYAWAMSQHMPYACFSWCSPEDVDPYNWPDDNQLGFILEVDLEYPRELHDAHSDLPLAPERLAPPGSKQSKLLTTLYNKSKYVLHYRNLKFYLSLGMKLVKVHRAISFLQKPFLRAYIDLNTEKRKLATNEFEKDFYKLMNNSVFGKTMENLRKRVDIRLATKGKQVDKWVAKPNFKSRTIFTENLAAIHMRRTKLLLNKPIYVGLSVLDLSKLLIYDFHYNTIKARYGDNAVLQYTDTDSLTYAINTPDFYADMKEMIDLFDTSDYKSDNPFQMPRVNKKVIGKMKDELKGEVMSEFVGLRSKMYAYTIGDREEAKKKAKGVKRSVVENELQFEDYKSCLFEELRLYKSMNAIRSYGHDLFSVEQRKSALSFEDNKRCVQADKITTLPWGHYRIPVAAPTVE